MTSLKTRLASLVIAAVAVVGTVSAAQAQESCGTGCAAHFVGAGSTSHFIMAAIAADQAALDLCNANYGGCVAPNFTATSGYTINHWSKKYAASPIAGAQLTDNRDSRIDAATGNVWVVWIENCTSGTCSTSDVWLQESVDATIGIRCFTAVQTGGVQGCGLQELSPTGTASDQIISKSPQQLWPDGNVDTTLGVTADPSIYNALNFGLNVNVALTDLRPEDALYATKRAYGTLNSSTYNDLGYINVTNKIGSQIYTDQGILQGTGGTGTFAQPVNFALAGQADPFGTGTVSSYTVYPLGAAPMVFIANNGGSATFPRNLVTGVTPDLHATGQVYPLANLFDGTKSCDTHNLAFGGPGDGLGNAVNLFLREPTAAAMNIVEFTLFRTFDNSKDSQETGVTSPNGGSPYNPLQLQCSASTATGKGYRSRALSTSEEIGTSGKYGLLGPLVNASASLGYIFTGWGNLGKFGGSANYNYLTLDGVDPIFSSPTSVTYGTCFNASNTPEYSGQICALNGNANEQCSGSYVCTAGGNIAQTVPLCNTATCSSDFWGSEGSYPNLRNGTYLAWAVQRWIANASSDPYGPSRLAQEAQNYVNQDITDFVPFSACPVGQLTCTTPTDGLNVFRSHFTPSGVTTGCTLSNGTVTTANAFNGGNTLGGGGECGGDVGGLMYGPFGTDTPQLTWVTWSNSLTTHKGYKLTYKNGDKFTASNPATGSAITLTCTYSTGAQTITNTTVGDNTGGASPSVYASVPNPDTSATIACRLVGAPFTHAAATSTQDGTAYDSKHQ